MTDLFERVREDFPRARTMAYFDNASSHPISVHSAAALHRYVDWVAHEVGEPWWPAWAPPRDQANTLFAQLINADPGEIAFARSTVESESNILNGLRDHLAGGNVVMSDLSFNPCIYNYKFREQQGLDVRIVKNRNWQIDMAAMEDAVDGNTRLISVALVSNVNGYVADVAALSKLAHDNGAYLYVDIMQAAGGVPIDVKAMGIDFAACSTFKWLMGVKGFGFLYVRSDLQLDVLKPSQPSGGVVLNYPPWVEEPDSAGEEISFSPPTGVGTYEVSYPSYEGVVCAQESLQYILRLGVDSIRNHARDLTDRLQEELPQRGYKSITPQGERKPHPLLRSSTPRSGPGQLQKCQCSCGDAFRQQDAPLTLGVQQPRGYRSPPRGPALAAVCKSPAASSPSHRIGHRGESCVAVALLGSAGMM